MVVRRGFVTSCVVLCSTSDEVVYIGKDDVALILTMKWTGSVVLFKQPCKDEYSSI